ncbi:hypothetical protein [Sinorhizobium alkalisoli]|uniref:hypothetical protein n=1 Tax=Sinorhizobium alkalisoli TaxID=1752398 RepID=UPI0012A9973A|nr:hypothetical protein [Sinorhizobium alkalisoli]QFI69482.1 hypothetical protein EKH55_4608 [Sinorhizobium alkalisoli]
MHNDTHEEIERIAGEAGWDSFPLLISLGAEEKDLSRSLIDHLSGLAADEDETDDEQQSGD